MPHSGGCEHSSARDPPELAVSAKTIRTFLCEEYSEHEHSTGWELDEEQAYRDARAALGLIGTVAQFNWISTGPYDHGPGH